MPANARRVMTRPQRSATKRFLWPWIALLVLSGPWLAKTLLPHRYAHLESALQDKLAQAFVGTRFADSRWAHSWLANYAQLDRYRAANQSLPRATDVRVVFYGDSITDFWATKYPTQFFPGTNYLGRGISGQSTRQMVWRFQQDVLELRPSTVVILAGTNDVILRSRQITYSQTIANIQAMAQASKHNGIRVLLCSILPISRPNKADQITFTRQILALNAWLQSYAAAQHLLYLDYFTPMSTPAETMNSAYSDDGTHPNATGYELMQLLAQRALTRP